MSDEKALARACRRLGRNMKRLRRALKLTQKEAAEKAGMHRRHWQELEKGEVNASLSTLAAVSVVLGVDTTALLTRPR